MHNISNIFYFGTKLYMFRTVFPSIIRSLRLYIQYQVYVIQVLWQLAATEPVWHILDAVCTVLDSWWWTERPSETCRILFQNKINLRYCASGWFCYRNILRSSVLQMSQFLSYFLILTDLQSVPSLVAAVRGDRSALAVGDPILQVTEQQLTKEIKPGAI